jgi:hypothetical protein
MLLQGEENKGVELTGGRANIKGRSEKLGALNRDAATSINQQQAKTKRPPDAVGGPFWLRVVSF